MSIESHRAGREMVFLANALKQNTGELITAFKKYRDKEFTHAQEEIYRLVDEMDQMLSARLKERAEEVPDDVA